MCLSLRGSRCEGTRARLLSLCCSEAKHQSFFPVSFLSFSLSYSPAIFFVNEDEIQKVSDRKFVLHVLVRRREVEPTQIQPHRHTLRCRAKRGKQREERRSKKSTGRDRVVERKPNFSRGSSLGGLGTPGERSLVEPAARVRKEVCVWRRLRRKRPACLPPHPLLLLRGKLLPDTPRVEIHSRLHVCTRRHRYICVSASAFTSGHLYRHPYSIQLIHTCGR